MLSGIGIVIILKQIPHSVGYDVDFEGDLSFFQPNGETTLTELLRMSEFITPGAVLISLISLAILGVVFIDLLKGIALGLTVGIVTILRDNFKNSHFLHIEEGNGKRKIRMHLADEITFLNKGAILNELNKLDAGTELTIDMSDCFSIDFDVVEIIENFRISAQEKGILVHMKTKEALHTADY